MLKRKIKNYKSLTVYCQCGLKLVKYKKITDGRLIKIHKDRIIQDFAGIFGSNFDNENTDIYCPNCGGRLATVKCVNGKYVNKLNQGMIGNIKR